MRTMRWGLGAMGLATVAALGIAVAGMAGPVAAQVASNDEEAPSRGERYRELLAGELGVTVEELTAAQETARDTLIDELLAAGDITEEQAERLKALEPGQGFRLHMRGHRIHNAIAKVFDTAAEIVGMPVEELRERIAGGESLAEVADGEGIDVATLKSDLVSALRDRIEQAVADGEINQDMADRLIENLDAKVERTINAEGPFQGRGFGPRGERFMERFGGN